MAKPRKSCDLVSLIRLAYPEPRSFYAGLRKDGRYCVGGAAYMFVHGLNVKEANRMQRFPTADHIAMALVRLNPNLSFLSARAYACAIVRANDVLLKRGPDRAWDILGEALGRDSGERAMVTAQPSASVVDAEEVDA